MTLSGSDCAQTWPEALEWLLNSRWFDPARLFLIIALPLAALYIYQLGDVSHFPHNKGRFLHSVHLALSIVGEGDRMPVSFIETLSLVKPFPNDSMAANACHWREEINHKYCHDFAPEYQNPTFDELAEIPFNPTETVKFSSYIFAAQYPFVGYIFYALGAGIGMLLQLSPIIILYLSLSVNALAVILIEYYALRLMPVLRWPMFYILLLPSSFIIRAQFMPDALVQAIGVLVVAVSLHLFYSPRALKPLEMAGLVALGFMSGFVKLAYMLMPLLFSIIPDGCFSRPRVKWGLVALTLALSIIAGTGWGLYAMSTLYPWELATNAGQPVSNFMQHMGETVLQPFVYLGVVFDTLFTPHQLSLTIGEIITGRGRWWRWVFHLPLFLFVIPPLLLAIPIQRDDIKYKLWERLPGIVTFFGTWVILCILMHFHRPGPLDRAPTWIQGRYLLPVFPFLILPFHSLVNFMLKAEIWLRYVAIELAFLCLICLNAAQLIAR